MEDVFVGGPSGVRDTLAQLLSVTLAHGVGSSGVSEGAPDGDAPADAPEEGEGSELVGEDDAAERVAVTVRVDVADADAEGVAGCAEGDAREALDEGLACDADARAVAVALGVRSSCEGEALNEAAGVPVREGVRLREGVWPGESTSTTVAPVSLSTPVHSSTAAFTAAKPSRADALLDSATATMSSHCSSGVAA